MALGAETTLDYIVTMTGTVITVVEHIAYLAIFCLSIAALNYLILFIRKHRKNARTKF